VEQFCILAASPGEYAENINSKKSGAFSSALFEVLNKQKGAWPPDMLRINRQLQERFAKLRDAGKAIQTPGYYWYRDWNGSEGSIGSPLESKSEAVGDLKPATAPRLHEIKSKALRERLAVLSRQYEAASRQLNATLNQSDKAPLEVQLRGLESEIAEAERQLGVIDKKS
jgi:hypothetical protein